MQQNDAILFRPNDDRKFKLNLLVERRVRQAKNWANKFNNFPVKMDQKWSFSVVKHYCCRSSAAWIVEIAANCNYSDAELLHFV